MERRGRGRTAACASRRLLGAGSNYQHSDQWRVPLSPVNCDRKAVPWSHRASQLLRLDIESTFLLVRSVPPKVDLRSLTPGECGITFIRK